MMEITSRPASSAQPITLAAGALIVILLGVGGITLWRAYSGSFPEPDRVGNKATEIRRDILKLGPDCPWALRRLKEDLRDLRGRRLFPDRHAHTVAFKLTMQEYDLYKAVTGYINQFFPQASGRKQGSVALARTVFQRRLASSTMATPPGVVTLAISMASPIWSK